MPAAWANVADQPAFLALPPEEQEHARQQYFQTVVAPRVPAEHLSDAQAQFDAHTKDRGLSAMQPIPAPAAGEVPAGPNSMPVFNLPHSLGEVGERLKASVGDVAGMGANIVNAGIGGVARPLAGYIGAARAPFVGGPQAQKDIEGFQHATSNLIPTTESGEQQKAALAGVVGPAIEKVKAALPNNPAAQTFIPAAADVLTSVGPLAAGGIVARGARSAAEAAAAASERAAPTPMQRVVQSGYEVAPNDVAQRTGTPIETVPGERIQRMTETPATVAARRQGNVTKATQAGANDIGLSATDQITPAHLKDASAAPGAVYDNTGQAVRSVNPEHLNPNTVQALEDAAADQTPQGQVPPGTQRDLRRIITGLESGKYNGTQIIKDVSSLREVGQRAPGARAAAAALESELENQLQRSGQNETLANFRAARQTFAKIQDVRDSLSGGRIDPQLVLGLRNAGRPLSAGLADIAHAADMAPNSVSLPGAVIGEAPPTTKLGIVAKTGKAVARAFTPDLSKSTGKYSQRSIAAAARAPSPTGGVNVPPIPRPGVNLEPPPGVVGREPPNQLGLTLAGGESPRTPFDLAPQTGLEPAPSPQGEMRLPPGRGNPPPAPAFELAAPVGEVGVHPLQRGAALPRATGPLSVSPQVSDQLGLRNEALPGRAVGDNGPTVATQGAGVPNASRGRSARAHAHEEGAVPARVRELLQAILEARRRGQ